MQTEHLRVLVNDNYAPGGKNGTNAGGHMFYIGSYRVNMKNTKWTSTRFVHIMPRALIFSMYHHLLFFYQFC